MKRPSLTVWILIALVAGIAFGAAFPGPAQRTRLAGNHFSAPDQVDHRAAALRDAGGRDRGHRQHQDHGPHRRQGDPLFRNRHHARAVRRTRRGESGAAGRGSRSCNTGRESRRRRPRARDSSRLSSTRFPPASSTRWRAAKCCRSSCSAFLFGTACAAIGAKARARGGLLRVALRRDVPLHQLRDAVRAARRVRRDGGHGRRQGPRRSAESRQAGADAVWPRRCFSSSSCWAR